MCFKKNGFTLVEVMIASVIGAFVAMVAVGALRVISAGAETVGANMDTAGEIRFASRKIANDLSNLYYDRNRKNMKLAGSIEMTEAGTFSRLIFHTVSRIQARAQQPEGDVYEVEYFLMMDEEMPTLMRRFWPNPSEDFQPGGILSTIAEGIDVFAVRYFDGDKWYIEWPEEMESIPELVEVTIAGSRQGGGGVIKEFFLVNFARAAGVSAIEQNEQEESTAENEQSGE